MSGNVDYLRAYFNKVWASGSTPEAAMGWARTHLSDDFQFLDKDGNVTMDRAGYIGFGHLLFASFNDMKLLYSDLREEGEDVRISGHWEGTFTGDLDLSAMGMGVIPASGKKIVLAGVQQQVENRRRKSRKHPGLFHGRSGRILSTSRSEAPVSIIDSLTVGRYKKRNL